MNLYSRFDTGIPEDAVLIDRSTPWGNPFTHLKGKTAATFVVDTIEEAVSRYETYLLNNPLLLSNLWRLVGKSLVCATYHRPCHGEVLMKYATNEFVHTLPNLEEVEDVWKFYRTQDAVVLATTCGDIKRDGKLVMGKGVALEATKHVPDVQKILGDWVKKNGNIPAIGKTFGSFPTKSTWMRKSEPNLIFFSACKLKEVAERYPTRTYYLPFPGIGNGGLDKKEVIPLLNAVGLPKNVKVCVKK